jgi:hypothetical protein
MVVLPIPVRNPIEQFATGEILTPEADAAAFGSSDGRCLGNMAFGLFVFFGGEM